MISVLGRRRLGLAILSLPLASCPRQPLPTTPPAPADPLEYPVRLPIAIAVDTPPAFRTSAGLSPDGRFQVELDQNIVIVTEARTGAPVASLRIESARGFAFASSDTSIGLAIGRERAIAWDLATGRVRLDVATAEWRSDERPTAVISADGRQVVAVGTDHVTLHDLESGRSTELADSSTLDAPSDDSAIAPDGRVATLDGDSVQITSPGGETTTIDLGVNDLLGLAFADEGRTLIAASEATTVWVELATGATSQRPRNPATTEPVETLSLSADGRWLAVGSPTRATVWDLDNGRRGAIVRGHTRNQTSIQSVDPPVLGARLHADGRTLLTAGADGRAILWDTRTGSQIRDFAPPAVQGVAMDGAVLRADLADEDPIALLSDAQGTVTVWNTATGDLAGQLGEGDREFRSHGPPISDYAHFADIGRDWAIVLQSQPWAIPRGPVSIELPDQSAFLDASNDAARIATLERRRDGTAEITVWDASTLTAIVAIEVPETDWHDRVQAAALSPDGRFLALVHNDFRFVVHEVDTGSVVHEDPPGRLAYGTSGLRFSADGGRLVSWMPATAAVLWDTATWTPLASLDGHLGDVRDVILDDQHDRVVTGGADGAVAFWSSVDGRPIATATSFLDGGFVVVDPTGHFDSDDFGRLPAVFATSPADPLATVPIDRVARDRFTPNLLHATLDGAGPSTAPRASRADPPTTFIEAGERDGDELPVRVRVCGTARDLRVTRDGRLAAWTDGTLEPAEGDCAVEDFRIRLPSGFTPVTVGAYAFGPDGSRGATVTLSADPMPTGRRRAFVVGVGVDDYAGRDLDLSFAVADARMFVDGVGAALADSTSVDEVVPVLLTSTEAPEPPPDGTIGGTADTTTFAAVLSALAGEPTPDAALRGPIDRLTRLGPDDTLIIHFAGHGFTDAQGVFHLMTTDRARGGPPDGTATVEDALSWSMDENELAARLRPIDAGRIVVVIDACQSAATIEADGFLPGPLDSPGLAQLAYDKGVYVLAASQSDAAALESSKIGHGVLTWVLVHEGIEGDEADRAPADGRIELQEWLAFAVDRVPEVADAILRHEAPRGGMLYFTDATTKEVAQQPRLFAYGDTRAWTVLEHPIELDATARDLGLVEELKRMANLFESAFIYANTRSPLVCGSRTEALQWLARTRGRAYTWSDAPVAPCLESIPWAAAGTVRGAFWLESTGDGEVEAYVATDLDGDGDPAIVRKRWDRAAGVLAIEVVAGAPGVR